jgi:hypothetical protein
MRRAWYVWEMNKHKSKVHDTTKERQQTEFEDAVMAYAQEIFERRRNDHNTPVQP